MPRTQAIATRRRFLQIAGLTGLASAVNANMLAWAQSRPSSSSAKADTAKADTARVAPGEQPPSEDARALAAIVQRRYGKHLALKQLEAVTTEINGRLEGGKRLRATALLNSDEPDFVFRPE